MTSGALTPTRFALVPLVLAAAILGWFFLDRRGAGRHDRRAPPTSVPDASGPVASGPSATIDTAGIGAATVGMTLGELRAALGTTAAVGDASDRFGPGTTLEAAAERYGPPTLSYSVNDESREYVSMVFVRLRAEATSGAAPPS